MWVVNSTDERWATVARSSGSRETGIVVVPISNRGERKCTDVFGPTIEATDVTALEVDE